MNIYDIVYLDLPKERKEFETIQGAEGYAESKSDKFTITYVGIVDLNKEQKIEEPINLPDNADLF